MFGKHTDTGYNPSLPGIEMKTLAYGEKTLMSEFILHRGHTLPRHTHPNEQTGYLVKGHIRLSIGGEVFEVLPGDSWCVLSNVEHGAQVVEDSVAIEVFAPRREDYIPK